MKILHYSDSPSSEIGDLYDQCDLFVTTGDLETTAFAYIEIKPQYKPGFGVYGNHDVGANYIERLNLTNIHNRVVEYNGILWGGFEGCLKYKEGSHMYLEEDAAKWANNFPYVDVLLLHAGGYGLLDDKVDPVHTGSSNISRYIYDKQPKYVFCGHQYSNAEMQVGSTKIYRTFGARIVEIF